MFEGVFFEDVDEFLVGASQGDCEEDLSAGCGESCSFGDEFVEA